MISNSTTSSILSLNQWLERQISNYEFNVHRAMHRNIISTVKPTRCTSVSNLFYFGMTLYMFRTVFLSIIRSSRLYIQQQAYVRQVLLSACQQACCCMYSLELLIMDGMTVQNMQSVIPKLNKLDTLVHLVGFTIELCCS